MSADQLFHGSFRAVKAKGNAKKPLNKK